MLSLSDIDGGCQLKLACLVSDTVRLIFIIMLQVRESASSQRSQELIIPRLLALVADCVNALNAYLHRRITAFELTCNLAPKHVRFVIVVPLVVTKTIKGRPITCAVSNWTPFLKHRPQRTKRLGCKSQINMAYARHGGSFCSAFGCSNNKSVNAELSFFRFPKDKDR